MNLFSDAIITGVTHASVVAFEEGKDVGGIKLRPWHGIAFSFYGEIIYKHEGKQIPLAEDQIVFLPKGETYSIDCIREGSFGVINFHTMNDMPREFINIKMNDINVLKREFNVILDLILTERVARHNDIFSSFYRILSSVTGNALGNAIPHVMSSALDIIDKNISDPELSNTLIADTIGISEVYLRKLFSGVLSTSVKKYVQGKRIEKAKRLLAETPMSVGDISEDCGYSSIYQFCRSFKKITGYTPTEYKNRYNISLF